MLFFVSFLFSLGNTVEIKICATRNVYCLKDIPENRLQYLWCYKSGHPFPAGLYPSFTIQMAVYTDLQILMGEDW